MASFSAGTWKGIKKTHFLSVDGSIIILKYIYVKSVSRKEIGAENSSNRGELFFEVFPIHQWNQEIENEGFHSLTSTFMVFGETSALKILKKSPWAILWNFREFWLCLTVSCTAVVAAFTRNIKRFLYFSAWETAILCSSSCLAKIVYEATSSIANCQWFAVSSTACDPHCSSIGCNTKGAGHCDGPCNKGYNLAENYVCKG